VFTDWLAQQHGRDDPVGDLARDATRDALWPARGSFSDLYDHLGELGASDAAFATLARAWTEFCAA
jgi:hypothetical protein